MTVLAGVQAIHAEGLNIAIYTENFQDEFISLPDIARYKRDESFIVINNWMRGKDTIYNAFTLSP